MTIDRFELNGKRNCPIKGVRTLPKKAPKAILQIFHGMGEHKERYLPFMEFMSNNGYACYAHDHRKHGESVTIEDGYGLFEPTDRFDHVIDDCYLVSRKILKDFPGTKIIVLGHSMGSVIARIFVAKNALIPSATIFMGTLPPFSAGKALVPRALAGVIDLFTGKHKRSTTLSSVLNKPLIAEYPEPRTDFDWLTRDETIVDAYVEDPLCGYAYTAKFYREFLKAIVLSTNSNLISLTKNHPILFISGDHDPVGENGAGVQKVHDLYSKYGYKDLTLKLVEGARHEVLNETDKLETFDYLLSWCNNTLV